MRLWISAGEASGDLLGAELVRELRPRKVRGIAGPAMRAAGVDPAERTENATAFGIVEVVRRVPWFLELLRRMEADATSFRPDVVVTIDAPDLNLRLGRRLRAHGIPVVHWVSPQVWAWRRGRVHSIARSCDRLLCLLPFEPALYEEAGVDAVFTGHPAYDRARALPRNQANVLGIFPGSRRSEVRRQGPAFAHAAHLLRRQHPSLTVQVSRAPTIDDLGPLADFEVVEGFAAVAGASRLALASSGTVTLELAAMGIPQVAAYRLHPLEWWLARALVRVPHITLPNLVLGRRAIPEHVQRVQPEALARDLGALLEDDRAQRSALSELGQRLGGGGAIARAAAAIREF